MSSVCPAVTGQFLSGTHVPATCEAGKQSPSYSHTQLVDPST